MPNLAELQHRIAAQIDIDEEDCVKHLFTAIDLSPRRRARIRETAEALILASRSQRGRRDKLEAFMEEFGLATREGVALMCLAEALLRIPDADTADSLIQEKLLQGDWREHLGKSDSVFVNASVWGLLLGGKMVGGNAKGGMPGFENSPRGTRNWLNHFVQKFSEPVLRQSMLRAMRLMGGQYILGGTVEEALRRAPRIYPQGTLYSFDALGEGARTGADAERHLQDYAKVIETVASRPAENGRNSVSIKLSAIHPRYQWTQRERVHQELLPRLRELALAAREADVDLSIDAEEAERLEICLEVFAALATDPALRDWSGLGFVLQAYQKRAITVADWLRELAAQRTSPLNVRLVKGAYWDREIKRSQQLGLADYPVFTRKANTDLSYLVCAQKLLEAGSENIFPQFATHNAATIASVIELAGERPFELQRLHGMGDLLYSQLSPSRFARGELPPIRVYAPVGGHRDLLPYLVRRLLENGANSSFVNRFLDDQVPAEKLAVDALSAVEANEELRSGEIPPPRQLFRLRANSTGLDIQNPRDAERVREAVTAARFPAGDDADNSTAGLSQQDVRNPSRPSVLLGHYQEAEPDRIRTAFAGAAAAQVAWDRLGGEARAEVLSRIAEVFEDHKLRLMGLIVREAGRTLVDAEAEVREAIDFCHYYGLQARQHFAAPAELEGPTGEDNTYSLHGRGVFLCISPWNFPMAIFVGQITAALAAGNGVVAKPAEQTTLVAGEIVKLMHEAGVPEDLLHLLAGEGSRLSSHLMSDPNLAGVAFTGSTETARRIQRALVEREGPILPFIAETGGINVMLVDSTALSEQVVDDVLASAFHSAGQRCSALRVLYLQDDTADEVLEMLCGACDELSIGDPAKLTTDIGPIIDEQALGNLKEYVEKTGREKKLIYRYDPVRLPDQGYFFGPYIFEVNSLADVTKEVFGPVLHVVRYRREDLPAIIDQINNSGYGLTLGVHSRIEGWARSIFRQTHVGNTYVNRNMIGAVVGVQPFGGHNLSGTGPKAGGPHYLFQFAAEKVLTINTVATGGNAALLNLEE
ncbi:bifunctional proline dehydrogenase/L-glutamate gamma-semialdehyde dehydrogenase PutA [Gilvimarinus sp. F26214L]|uniref:bifunctional proline dehydrogenase/L-glutamate gamma-semialdehyde dehydrogenase PutA n=1 Tax=Gilvimarinus sp. DZF01 TaxID=3461371 RepID=UPI004045786B